MSTKAQRGTKRTCQNPECGSRFYDLNRDTIVCPVCSTEYELAPQAAVIPAVTEKRPSRPAPKKPVYTPEADKPDEVLPEAEGDEVLADVEGDAEPAAGDDETFLEEEEEDGADVSGIIGGPVAEPEEPDR